MKPSAGNVLGRNGASRPPAADASRHALPHAMPAAAPWEVSARSTLRSGTCPGANDPHSGQ